MTKEVVAQTIGFITEEFRTVPILSQSSTPPEHDSSANNGKTKLPKVPGMIDVCGKRTLEYVIEILGRFNRAQPEHSSVILRSIGANIGKAVGVSQILVDQFSCEVEHARISPIVIRNIDSSCLELVIKPCKRSATEESQYTLKNGFIEFPVYHLLFDALLAEFGELRIVKQERYDGQQQRREVIKIERTATDFSCIARTEMKLDEDDAHARIAAAYYRCGMIFSPEWERVGSIVSEFDDVIIGIDTNILLRAVLSEQLLSSLSLVSPRAYVHTPNWVLIVIPNAVLHELEQTANSRNDRGLLNPDGRLAFRALQEILELNRSADISGVSLMIVGDANPVLDTRVELRALRADFSKRDGQDDGRGAVRFAKKSSCDMIIRAQFKEFLRQIDFHKGLFFLTADKSNAALARAEGLRSIYYKNPPDQQAKGNVKPREVPCGVGAAPIRLTVPLGRLLYELAVEFGRIEIEAPRWGKVEIACDAKGESLDHWLQRELIIKHPDFKKLMALYNQRGGISLGRVSRIWNNTMDAMLGSEVVS